MSSVALVEDDQTMVALLKTLLQFDGFEVTVLDIDADIQAAVESNPPDALILDVHLPRQNGLDVLQAIHNSPAARNTRIIMISGMNVKDDCLKLGADDFLLKPFMASDLISMLRKNIPAS